MGSSLEPGSLANQGLDPWTSIWPMQLPALRRPQNGLERDSSPPWPSCGGHY
uniref:Uncharacterized protein n=1 Tax=Leviviridae sp. TaxID=2027243 RepID=A0A514D2X6_9VIRU|nr:MAG: hypothetical protein H1Bulk29504_000004 [Leviviridae sp.]